MMMMMMMKLYLVKYISAFDKIIEIIYILLSDFSSPGWRIATRHTKNWGEKKLVDEKNYN